MKQAEFNNEIAQAYLLGQLPEDEAAQLEALWFGNDTLYAQLQAVQNELLDAYVRGALSAAKRASFERQHAVSPFMRERLAFASALAEHVAPPALNTLPSATMTSASWWQRARASFDFTPWRWQFATGFALLLLVSASVWLLQQNNQLRQQVAQTQAQLQQTEQQLAQTKTALEQFARTSEPRPPIQSPSERLSPTPTASPAPTERALAFVLLPLTFRAGNDLTRLSIPPGMRTLQLQLRLPNPTTAIRFSVAIETSEETQVWQRSGLTAQQVEGQTQVKVTLPASTLENNDYFIKLKGRAASGAEEELASYQVRVLRP